MNVSKPVIIFITVILFSILLTAFDHQHFSGIDGELEENNFSTKLFHRLYLTLTTFTSVGYGDIYPISVKARSVIMLMFVILLCEFFYIES